MIYCLIVGWLKHFFLLGSPPRELPLPPLIRYVLKGHPPLSHHHHHPAPQIFFKMNPSPLYPFITTLLVFLNRSSWGRQHLTSIQWQWHSAKFFSCIVFYIYMSVCRFVHRPSAETGNPPSPEVGGRGVTVVPSYYMYITIYLLSVCLSIYISVCLSTCLFIYLSIHIIFI